MAKPGPEKKRPRRPAVDRVAVGIRRAFYRGLSRDCLNQAWGRLNVFRNDQVEVKYFRGKCRERRGIVYERLSAKIGRPISDLSKWFTGQSPEWANIILVMTSLSADYSALLPMASKSSRRSSACMEALQFARRKVLKLPRIEPDSFLVTVRCLESLFSDETWVKCRNVPSQRPGVLRGLAKELAVSAGFLDLIDRNFGDAYVIWNKHYANAIDEEIWR